MDILKVSNLTKVYGKGAQATCALDDVSFSIPEGQFVAIVGASGSGKSTLLHLIGGVDRPTSGTVELNGANIYARTDEQLAVFRRREVASSTSSTTSCPYSTSSRTSLSPSPSTDAA